jgi:hypothetical protein
MQHRDEPLQRRGLWCSSKGILRTVPVPPVTETASPAHTLATRRLPPSRCTPRPCPATAKSRCSHPPRATRLPWRVSDPHHLPRQPLPPPPPAPSHPSLPRSGTDTHPLRGECATHGQTHHKTAHRAQASDHEQRCESCEWTIIRVLMTPKRYV